MILLAPPLYAASIYMTLGRLIGYLDAERLSPVSTKWLTAIFVTGDVIAFLAQGAGIEQSSILYHGFTSILTIF